MTELLNVAALQRKASDARRSILTAIHRVGTGHVGSSLSCVELLTYLYSSFLDVSPARRQEAARDRLVFSKGHGAPALYAVLAHHGFLDPAMLMTLRQFGSPLQGHPNATALDCIDVSTGSLGQGISVALGIAMGLRRLGLNQRVICVLGDGEMQEGQNWEAFMAAAHFKAGNLIAVVDRNSLQNDGPTEEIIGLDPIAEKLRSFGWSVSEIDGHDFYQIAESLAAADGVRPHFVVANTIKGRGVSFMENVVHWHHHPISDAELVLALDELARAA